MRPDIRKFVQISQRTRFTKTQGLPRTYAKRAERLNQQTHRCDGIVRCPCEDRWSRGDRSNPCRGGRSWVTLAISAGMTTRAWVSKGRMSMGVLDRFRLDGKVALVTGGARGLGRVISEALAGAGASVALTA